MNDIFDIRRFGKYLLSDLRRIASGQWLNLTVTALLGTITYLTVTLWNGVFYQTHSMFEIEIRSVLLMLAGIIICTYIPVRCYAFITDRKKGAAYLMIPASSLEKWLSMLLVTAMIIPALFFTVYFGSDAVICALDSHCGESLFGSIFITESLEGSDVFDISLPLAEVIIPTILAYLTGTLWFKKHKTTKTTLCLAALFITATIAIGTYTVPSAMEDLTQIEEAARPDFLQGRIELVKTIITIVTILWTAGLAAATYFRIRTIKH